MATLSSAQHESILAHFNRIYECEQLGERELRMVYLAYLLKNDWLVNDGGWLHIHSSVREVTDADYELTDEETQGDAEGVNLELTIDYYNLDKLAELL